MAIKFGMSLAEMIAQLTRGFIKATGKKPDPLAKIKIRTEAFKRFKDQKKVVDMEGNVLDPNKPIMGGRQVEEGPINWDEVNKIDIEEFAGGGVAGMLGEPTYQDDIHRVPYDSGNMVLPKEKPFQGLFHTEVGGPVITKDDSEFEAVVDRWSQFARQQGEGPEDVKRNKSFALENIVRIGKELGYEDDEIKEIILRINKADGGRVPLKKGKSPMPSDKTTSQLLDINFDEYSIEEIIDMLKSVGAYQGGGRVPLGKGKSALQGLAKLMDEFFPGTTKIGQTSKPLAKKTQLKQALADFRKREEAAKLKKLKTWEDPDKVRAAVDDIFSSGDYKYDAQMASEALVENNPKAFGNKLFDDLDDRTRTKIYGAVVDVVQKDLAKMLQLKRASKPEKTLKGIEETGTIDISDPNIAEEFTKFMKETDPKGYAKIQKVVDDANQQLELKRFKTKGKKGHASGGLAGMLGE